MISSVTPLPARRPPALYPGARIGLVAPGSPVTDERIERALAECRELGLDPVLAPGARCRTGFLAGPDATRLADLQAMLDDPTLAAIWALRGGYGTMRLLPRLQPPAKPRVYLGFSDNTAVHLWLRSAGLGSFHGPHAGGGLTATSRECLERVLFQAAPAGELPLPPRGVPPVALVPGVAVGRLVGGNLALLAALCGTPWQPAARGCILFVEDVGEPGYRVDRLLRQLQLARALDGVAGLAGGQFSECGTPEEAEEVSQVLRAFAGELGVPAVLGLPIGHDADNWTLPLGVLARLDADAGSLTVLEPAVEPT